MIITVIVIVIATTTAAAATTTIIIMQTPGAKQGSQGTVRESRSPTKQQTPTSMCRDFQCRVLRSTMQKVEFVASWCRILMFGQYLLVVSSASTLLPPSPKRWWLGVKAPFASAAEISRILKIILRKFFFSRRRCCFRSFSASRSTARRESRVFSSHGSLPYVISSRRSDLDIASVRSLRGLAVVGIAESSFGLVSDCSLDSSELFPSNSASSSYR
mgnify:CR=1 FL=1